MDKEESALAAENLALFAKLRLPVDHHGGRRVSISQPLARTVLSSFQAGFERAERKGNAGGLTVIHGGWEHTFFGFEDYNRVQADLVPSSQKRSTTMLPVHELEERSWQPLLFNGIPGFEELIASAKLQAGAGLTLLACHMLRQDSKQACFAWHQDNLNNPFVKLSMVFLLSEGSSSMRVAGFEAFNYATQGDGCAFPSAAHHRSGPPSPGVLKITFFFGEPQAAAALLVARQARGEW